MASAAPAPEKPDIVGRPYEVLPASDELWPATVTRHCRLVPIPGAVKQVARDATAVLDTTEQDVAVYSRPVWEERRIQKPTETQTRHKRFEKVQNYSKKHRDREGT